MPEFTLKQLEDEIAAARRRGARDDLPVFVSSRDPDSERSDVPEGDYVTCARECYQSSVLGGAGHRFTLFTR